MTMPRVGVVDWREVWHARREYLLGRYEVNGWSLRQIAVHLGVSRERIRQELAAAYQARDGRLPDKLGAAR